MAVAYVRDTGLIATSSATSSNGSFASLPAVGNHVFALTGSWNAGSENIAFADNQSNTWAADKQATPSGGQQHAAIGSAKVATSAGTFTITVSATTAHYWKWAGVEFSGLASASWKDQTGSGAVGTGQTSLTVTASGANTQANALVLAVMADSSADATGNISDPPSGYTKIAVEQNCQSVIGMQSSYKIVSAVATSAVTWSFDSTVTEGACGALVTYKDATPGGAVTTHFLHPFLGLG